MFVHLSVGSDSQVRSRWSRRGNSHLSKTAKGGQPQLNYSVEITRWAAHDCKRVHLRIANCSSNAFSTALTSERDRFPNLLFSLCLAAVMIWSAIALRDSPFRLTSASPG